MQSRRLIGMDRYGLPMFLPTSQDYVVAIDWFPEEAVELA